MVVVVVTTLMVLTINTRRRGERKRLVFLNSKPKAKAVSRERRNPCKQVPREEKNRVPEMRCELVTSGPHCIGDKHPPFVPADGHNKSRHRRNRICDRHAPSPQFSLSHLSRDYRSAGQTRSSVTTQSAIRAVTF